MVHYMQFKNGGEKRRGEKNQKSQKVLPNLSLKDGRGHPVKAGLEKLLKNQFNQGGKIDKEIT